LESLPVGET
jgi:hypothetical protein